MLKENLRITEDRLKMMNDFLMDPDNPLVNDLLAVIDRYGGVEEINRKAREAGKVESLGIDHRRMPVFAKDAHVVIGCDRVEFVPGGEPALTKSVFLSAPAPYQRTALLVCCPLGYHIEDVTDRLRLPDVDFHQRKARLGEVNVRVDEAWHECLA